MKRRGRFFLSILVASLIPSIAYGAPVLPSGPATDSGVGRTPGPCATDDAACLIDLSLRQVYAKELAERQLTACENDLRANEKEAKAPVSHHNFGWFLGGLGVAAGMFFLAHKLDKPAK